jgi:hypothetical protein
MSQKQRLLLIYAAQALPMLIFPPSVYQRGLIFLGVVVVLFAMLAYGLLRGQGWALAMSIFMQGFNFIVRLLMFFPNAALPQNLGGGLDLPYVSTSLLSMALSVVFLFRLDQPDVRSTIVT